MIDYFWHVPVGGRTASSSWQKYYLGDKDIPVRVDGVYFAHGGPFLIDEVYYFDDEEDAKWFLAEGFRGMLLEHSDGVKEDVPDRLHKLSTDIVTQQDTTF